MNRTLKNSIGVLAVLALLPLAIKTVSTPVAWLHGEVTRFQALRAASNYKRLVLKTKCTYADRRKRAEQELGPLKPNVPCPAGDVIGWHPCKFDQKANRRNLLENMLSLDFTEEACLKQAASKAP